MPMMPAETIRHCGSAAAALLGLERAAGTFEPWLAGDRQTSDSVAKARNPEQNGVV